MNQTLLTRSLRVLYRPILRRAARQILEGRLLDPDAPRRGRWSRSDVEGFLGRTWAHADELLPYAELDQLPSIGNRHNVFLAVVTTGAYRAMLDRGESPERAIELFADVGWKVYAWMLRMAAAPARLVTRDPQKRLEKTLRALMVFPFDAPGAPGYEVEAWSDEEGYHTHWTHCPPQTFVRRVVADDDRGDLEAFYRSWCLYDWPGADELVKDGRKGHYRRLRTLSAGDPVCDMCWHAKAHANVERRRPDHRVRGPRD